MASQTIGDRIKVARERRQMTRTAVAYLIGEKDEKVGRWERGQQEPPLCMVEPLAKALGVERVWLAFGERQRRAG